MEFFEIRYFRCVTALTIYSRYQPFFWTLSVVFKMYRQDLFGLWFIFEIILFTVIEFWVRLDWFHLRIFATKFYTEILNNVLNRSLYFNVVKRRYISPICFFLPWLFAQFHNIKSPKLHKRNASKCFDDRRFQLTESEWNETSTGWSVFETLSAFVVAFHRLHFIVEIHRLY